MSTVTVENWVEFSTGTAVNLKKLSVDDLQRLHAALTDEVKDRSTRRPTMKETP